MEQMESLYDRFASAAAAHPQRPAVVDASGGRSMSYSELSGRVDTIAEELRLSLIHI